MKLNKYFQILGLDQDASAEEVKHAYRLQVNAWHPDRYSDNPRGKKLAEEKIRMINRAYAELKPLFSQQIKTVRINREDLHDPSYSGIPLFQRAIKLIKESYAFLINDRLMIIKNLFSKTDKKRFLANSGPGSFIKTDHAGPGTDRSTHEKNFEQVLNEIAGTSISRFAKKNRLRKRGSGNRHDMQVLGSIHRIKKEKSGNRPTNINRIEKISRVERIKGIGK